MAIPENIPTIARRWTEGDLEDPIEVTWNQVVTAEASEIIIERKDQANVIVAGVIIDAATGKYNYPWTSGALVAGEGQLVKARLTLAGSRRKSTEYFKINVDEDIAAP